MKAAQVFSKGVVKLVELPEPRPGAGEVLIRVKSSGICGTDVHIFEGQGMGGTFPILPGHEFAGDVVEVGGGVSQIALGARVAVEPNFSCNNCPECLENRQHLCRNWTALGTVLPGSMTEYVVAPEYAVFDIGDLPYDAGAFMEPLSCVLHGVERMQLRLADRVLLLGTGPIGLLMIRALKVAGASTVDAVEIDPARRKIAASDLAGGRAFASIEEAEARIGGGFAYDVVIDATGNVGVQARAVDLVRAGGKAMFFGVAPEGATFPFEPYKLFKRELTMMSSFTSLRNSLEAIRYMASGRIPVVDLISHHLPLDQFGDALTRIQAKKELVMKVMIHP